MLCREVGCSLPPQLLADGLPSPETDGEIAPDRLKISLSEFIELWVREHPSRKTNGLFLTPPEIARQLLESATAGRFQPDRVLDPAVGAGVFLIEALRIWGPDVDLLGIDIDPVAVAITRLRLWLAAADLGTAIDVKRLTDGIRWGDTLLDPALGQTLARKEGVDLVCGNPPFGNGIERRTARTEQDRQALKAIFPETARGPYDRSVLFVHASARLLRPGGRLALLVPRALLAARYAIGLREWMARETPLSEVVVYPEEQPITDGEIAMIALLADREEPAHDIRVIGAEGQTIRDVRRSTLTPVTWGGLLHPLAEELERSARMHPSMRDRFEVRASATVGEAYRLADQIAETNAAGYRFLTTGLVRRYGDRWAYDPARYLRRRFTKPILPDDSPHLSPERRRLYGSPKIVLAGLSRVLRAKCDEDGCCAGGVGTLLVLPRDSEIVERPLLRRTTLLLNSAWLSMLHRCRNGPMSLSGGTVPLGRRDVEALPFPESLCDPAGEFPLSSLFEVAGRDPVDLPEDTRSLCGMLDAAYEILSVTLHGDIDILVQRILLKMAGCSAKEAGAILEAWLAVEGGDVSCPQSTPAGSLRQEW